MTNMKQIITTIFITLFIIISGMFLNPPNPPLLKGEGGLFAQTKILKIGDIAPDFYLKTLQDEEVFFADLFVKDSQHVVVLSFFQTTCKPCIKEIPLLTRILEKLNEKKLKFYLINVGEDIKIVNKFIEEHNITLPVLMDRYMIYSEEYDALKQIPKTYIISKDRKIQKIFIEGIKEEMEEELMKFIKSLFK